MADLNYLGLFGVSICGEDILNAGMFNQLLHKTKANSRVCPSDEDGWPN
jgi:hypothetical protein